MESIPRVLLKIESSRESGRKLIAGISDYARKLGPWQFIWEPQGLGGLQQKNLPDNIDGILVRDNGMADFYREAGVPMVVFSYNGQPTENTVVAGTDDQMIANEVASHLVEQGFRHFAFYAEVDSPWASGRCKHFKGVLNKRGFEVDVCWGEEQLQNWIQIAPKPLGLMAANDDQARKVVQLCREVNIRVPEDCAVVGVDNDPVVCGLCDPPLSSISLDQFQAGFDAATILDQMMKGHDPETSRVVAKVQGLVVRHSSDILPIEDQAVSKAIRFIQQNVHRPLSVDEIAFASGLFRRGLERKFREHFDQSIQQRYHEVRAEYVTRLVAETRLSLELIAGKCGFSQPSHLTRFFKKTRGVSPSEYRRNMNWSQNGK